MRRELRYIAALVFLTMAGGCYKKPLTPVTLDELVAPGYEIAGTWATNLPEPYISMDVDYLSFEPAGERYSVEFYTAGCVGEDRVRTMATYDNGIIKLDQPITEYCCTEPYDTLYLIRVGKELRLLPSVNLDSLLSSLNGSRKHMIMRSDLADFAYHKYKKQTVAK